jgi:hypothetical protein
VLLKAGANRLLRNKSQLAALDIATSRNLPELISLLKG